VTHNPSIERRSLSRLRQPKAAAHVERSAHTRSRAAEHSAPPRFSTADLDCPEIHLIGGALRGTFMDWREQLMPAKTMANGAVPFVRQA
jgi:hypothetical protein